METNNGLAGRATIDRLSALEVGEGIAYDRMVVFPLFGEADRRLDYRTLGEGIAEGWVEVVEQAEASVPELVLQNRGSKMVLVLDGEEIVGGRQDRIVNASFMVGAGNKVKLPVTCVEHGRWHETSSKFRPGEASFFSLKREKFQQVRANLRAGGGQVADQSAVWNSIESRRAGMGAQSETGAMNDVFRAHEHSLADYERAFPMVQNTVGLAVALSGHMAGGDIFDQSRTAAALWGKLVRSYALDALDGRRGALVSRQQAVRFLARAKNAECEEYASLAFGRDVRFEGDGLVGGGLVCDGTPVHISLFRTHPDRGQTRVGTTLAAMSRRVRIIQ